MCLSNVFPHAERRGPNLIRSAILHSPPSLRMGLFLPQSLALLRRLDEIEPKLDRMRD